MCIKNYFDFKPFHPCFLFCLVLFVLYCGINKLSITIIVQIQLNFPLLNHHLFVVYYYYEYVFLILLQHHEIFQFIRTCRFIFNWIN